MFENVDGRTTDGRTTDARVTGILIAHLGAFGSGELITIRRDGNSSHPDRKIDHKLLKKDHQVHIISDEFMTECPLQSEIVYMNISGRFRSPPSEPPPLPIPCF